MLLSVTSLLMSRGEMKRKASLSLAATSSSSSTRGIPPICVDTPSNRSESRRIYNLIDNLGIPQRCKKQIKTILCCSRNNNRPLTIFRSYKICNLSKPQKLNKNSPPETILFYLQYHCCWVMRLTHVRCQDNIYTHILRYS